MAERGASKGRILVVDDDRLVLATVTHGLAQAGYEVIDADNGDDAILLAREHRPQLALLDIRMEGKSGFDVAETLRDVYRIPFMFLSAFSDEATLAQVKALGALAYLVKPLDVGQIVPSVEAAFARLRSGEALPAAAGAAASAGAAGRPAAAGRGRADAPPFAEPCRRLAAAAAAGAGAAAAAGGAGAAPARRGRGTGADGGLTRPRATGHRPPTGSCRPAMPALLEILSPA